jgi:hypothetical protein
MQIEWIIPSTSDQEVLALIEIDPRALRAKVWMRSRYDYLLSRLPQGGEIDAPFIYFNRGNIKIGDGIHRTAASITLGLPTIKVQVYRKEARAVRLICDLRVGKRGRVLDFVFYLNLMLTHGILYLLYYWDLKKRPFGSCL